MSVTFSTLDKKIPKLNRDFFNAAKDSVLGKSYTLSVTFVDKKTIQNLNKSFRNKNKPTDILSFSLDKKNGEILFYMPEVKRKAPLFKKTQAAYLNFLFIHGLLHLKGMQHGGKMESEEQRLCQKFAI